MQDRDCSGGGRDSEVAYLVGEVNAAMRPALADAAREVVLAAQCGDDPPSEDPEVLLHGIYEIDHLIETGAWEEFVVGVERMMDDHDPDEADEALTAIESLLEAARVIVDRLSGVLTA